MKDFKKTTTRWLRRSLWMTSQELYREFLNMSSMFQINHILFMQTAPGGQEC